MKSLSTAVLALCLSACASLLPIDQLMARYIAAWDRADPQALAANYADDGALIIPTGDRFTGREAIAQFYGAAFARGYAGRPGHARIIATHADGDKVSATGAWSVEPLAGHPGARECGTVEMTARREGGDLKIVALHEIAAPCPRQG